MPITKDDVLKALNDPALGRISFSVGQIKVNAEEFRKVSDCIYAGDITVTPGNETLAYYSSHLNELTTQRGNPPLDYTDRAQLLHECTHAIVDINKWKVLRLQDEVAGYLTQMTYSMISDFSPLVPPVLPPGAGSPLGRLVWTVKEVVLRYGLHQTKGFGAAISPQDIAKMVEVVHAHPDYAAVGNDEVRPEADLGVPGKHLEMERQRAILAGKQDKMITLTDDKTGRAAVKPLNRPRRKPAPLIRRQ
jgi:hypothetical protein